jgi:hypothetical protein
MKNAIQKAIEGGYTVKNTDIEDKLLQQAMYHVILLDPLFWQCLGKAMGWGNVCGDCETGILNKYCKSGWHDNDTTKVKEDMWKIYWHNFIDHIADGRDVDTFFNNLINK